MAQASAEKLEHTGPAEKGKNDLSATASSWQVYQSRLCQKKKQSRQYSAPNRKGTRKRVKMSESRALARKRNGSEREHGKERVESTVKEGRFQGKGEGKQEKPP